MQQMRVWDESRVRHDISLSTSRALLRSSLSNWPSHTIKGNTPSLPSLGVNSQSIPCHPVAVGREPVWEIAPKWCCRCCPQRSCLSYIWQHHGPVPWKSSPWWRLSTVTLVESFQCPGKNRDGHQPPDKHKTNFVTNQISCFLILTLDTHSVAVIMESLFRKWIIIFPIQYNL